MFIGDGAKLVRDAFALAKEKAPAIIFIDELDAIGTKRFDSDKSGDREVQRTMLELLNQLDGFGSDERIKVWCPVCLDLYEKPTALWVYRSLRLRTELISSIQLSFVLVVWIARLNSLFLVKPHVLGFFRFTRERCPHHQA